MKYFMLAMPQSAPVSPPNTIRYHPWPIGILDGNLSKYFLTVYSGSEVVSGQENNDFII